MRMFRRLSLEPDYHYLRAVCVYQMDKNSSRHKINIKQIKLTVRILWICISLINIEMLQTTSIRAGLASSKLYSWSPLLGLFVSSLNVSVDIFEVWLPVLYLDKGIVI